MLSRCYNGFDLSQPEATTKESYWVVLGA